ncbi:flagellar operon protein TIGR03826 [Natronincola peptidivorans]|uniref:Flagellar operon protein TIGR03826 n=1 Tax=Natronincola peptidivorans TaxID=426128 RepID=A0A1H9ZR36_9FIRM|nr:TIGR03826 family flagellar region protein [Natronincola peptidivorans]SES84159.1 flagellar operon protein TIGR03826 [Natronincola peptidivorans]
MELRNCVSCNRTFAYNGSDLCSRCGNTDEDDFKKVKEYLYDNPGASIIEVSEATDVSEKKILRFLRENRIEIKEEDNMLLDCERCGASIRSGRFCDSCAGDLKKELSKALKTNENEKEAPKKTNKSHKMFIAERKKNN